MKIVLVNSTNDSGGAARACFRLHQALLCAGIESYLFVQRNNFPYFNVLSSTSRLKSIIPSLRAGIDQWPCKLYPHRSKSRFSSGLLPSPHVVRQINKIKPNVVHLHWICDGMLSISDLCKIEAPILWTLHDQWPFTGGCHYDEGCDSYTTKCSKCRVLGSKKKIDLSTIIFNKKLRTYNKISDLEIVTPSKWMMSCTKKSKLLGKRPIVCVPNPIDTMLYKPMDKDLARKLWNFPSKTRLILFGAMGPTSDPRKGFKLLSKAISKIKDQDFELVVLGGQTLCNAEYHFDIKTHCIGPLYDDISLITLYNAVDMLVLPSIQENLSNMIAESLACGTPVVAFETGGNSDLIDHKLNGYLATPFDPGDLASGIMWILENEGGENLSKNARQKAISTLESSILVSKFIEIYKAF